MKLFYFRILVFESVEPFRGTTQDRGVTSKVNVPDNISDVDADQALIAQVFAALLLNVLKYTDGVGMVTVSPRAGDHLVSFSVADVGRGDHGKAFKRYLEQFFRLPGQITEKGLGLSLSIQRKRSPLITERQSMLRVVKAKTVYFNLPFQLSNHQ